MARRGHRSRKRNRKKQRRGWLLFGISALLLGVLVVSHFWGTSVGMPGDSDGGSRRAVRKVQKKDTKKIRVLLTNDAMNDVYHDQISFCATGKLTVSYGTRTDSYLAGETVTLTRKRVKKAGGTVKLTCRSGRIQVTSITRGGKTPAYRGSMQVAWRAQGLLLINRLSLREYLYGVVPGEMPASYPMEALKAQAVCARSFAWQQIRSDRCKEYGADVEDTTAFQVYHTTPEDKRCRRAVNETAGEMLYCDGKVVTAYYYSTSWGCSASEAEAWGGENDSGYYPVRLQTVGGEKLRRNGLADEEVFRAFLQDERHTYDSAYDWYRWNTEISAEQLGAALGIGTARKIAVLERGKSGLIQKLRVRGTEGRITLEGQEQIRRRLLPEGTLITKESTGEQVTLSMLPSAAFFVQEGVSTGTTSDAPGSAAFFLQGGGLGHGVGMSQNGAAGMAKEGADYQEILAHYYQGVMVQ